MMDHYRNSGGIKNGYGAGQRSSGDKDSVMRTVDLFSGQLKLPLSLGYLEGSDGLDINLQIDYSPGSRKQFYMPANERPDSVLGYQWNFTLPCIVAGQYRARQMYQRNFYLIGEGGSYPLYRKGSSEAGVEFYSIEHPFWKFYYSEDGEASSWEVWKTDGSRWKYGGNSGSKAKSVCWDNWTGPSVMNGAQVFDSAWYLSGVTSSKGNKVSYVYEKSEETLGDCIYTKAVRLQKVISAYGEEAVFTYAQKEAEEYTPKHTPRMGENAYQECYDDRYLQRMEVFNREHTLLYTQKLAYELKASCGSEVRRMLKSITHINNRGVSLEPLELTYHTEGETEGLLAGIQYPLASKLTYAYEQTELCAYQGEGQIALDRDWDSRVYDGGDFHFILLNRDGQYRYRLYGWDMRFRLLLEDTLPQTRLEDVNVHTGSGYVCITWRQTSDNGYKMRLLTRSSVKQFAWSAEDRSLEGERYKPSFCFGRDFIAYQYGKSRLLKILRFDFTDSCWHEQEMETDGSDYQAFGAGEGFFFGAYGNKDSKKVRFRSFYLDEDHLWRSGDMQDMEFALDWEQIKTEYVWAVGPTYAGACFVNHRGNRVDTSLVLLAWTDAFRFTRSEIHQYTYSDATINPVFFAVATGTLIGYGENIFRYSPDGWHYYKLLDTEAGRTYCYSYGDDLALGVEKDGNSQRFYAIRFDPYRNDWCRDEIPHCADISGKDLCLPLVAGDYAVLGYTLFTRDDSDGWRDAGYLPEGTDYQRLEISGKGDYLLCPLLQEECILQIPLENGKMGEERTVCRGERLDSKASAGRQAGTENFYTFSSQRSDPALHFYHLDDNKYSERKWMSMLKQIHCDYGVMEQDIYLDYEQATIRLEGGLAAIQKVQVLPASSEGRFGKREYMYYNGASPEDFDYPEDEYTNVGDYYSSAFGQIYGDTEYDGGGEPVIAHKNWLWSMDKSGFHLLPKKITETNFLPAVRFSEMKQEPDLAAVEKETLITYEGRFYQKRQTIRPGRDAFGKEIRLCEQIKYAWEESEEMLENHQIEAVVMAVKKELISGEVLAAERYQYEKTPQGSLYQSKEFVWDGTGTPTTATDNWLTRKQLRAVTASASPLTEEDAEGMKKTYIYDKAEQFITAQFSFADTGEAIYCGFEPYEECSKIKRKNGKIEESVTERVKFSGTQSLMVEAEDAVTLSVLDNGAGNRLTFMCKAETELHIVKTSRGISKEYIYTPINACWQKADVLLQNKDGISGAIEVTISSAKPFYLDAVFLCPMLSQAEAFVFSENLMFQTASHKNDARGSRTIYDSLGNAVASAGDNGVFTSYARRRYGRRCKGKAVDEILAAEMPKGGGLYHMEQENGDTPYWERKGNEWVFSEAEHFLFALWGEAESLYYDLLGIKKNKEEWEVSWDGKKLESIKTDGVKQYLLIKVGNRIQFSSEDEVLFEAELAFGRSAALKMTAAQQDDVTCIGFAPNPRITVSCVDYAQKPHQNIAVTETGIVVEEILYNQIESPEITTKKLELKGQLWKYRPDFVTKWDQTSGKLEGEIAEGYPLDEGFAYFQIHNYNMLTARPWQIAQAGKLFALKGDGKTLRFRYLTNGEPICGQDPYTCMVKEERGPDGHILMDVTDRFGQKILSITGGADMEEQQKLQYLYDAAGNLIEVRYPNYFDAAEGQKSFVSRYEYDTQGNMVFQKETDAAEIRTIYTRAGKQRFRQQDGSGRGYVYTLYDTYGRMTEEGWCAGAWQEAELKRAAEEMGVAPEGGNARCRYYYDGDGNDGRLLGKRTEVEYLEEDGGLATKEEYWYDERQNLVRKAVTTGAKSETLFMDYDEDGNVISYQSDGETIGYQYDMQSRMNTVRYQGEMIYQCAYLPEGGLLRECFFPGKEEEFYREYTYDNNLWLTKLSDPFFEQELEYYDKTTTKQDFGLAGKITGSKSKWKAAVGAAIPQSIRYQYQYDTNARLCGFERNGAPTTMTFDGNRNQTKNNELGFDYESGKNRLSDVKDNQLTYDAMGNVLTMSEGKMDFSYDKVSGRIRHIKAKEDNISFTYGPQGIAARSSTAKNTFVMRDQRGRLFSESIDGERILCIYGGSGIAAQVRKGNVYCILKDYQSSVRAICNGKTLLAAFAYDPFGAMETEVYSNEEVQRLIPLRFTSARYEKTLGIYTMKYRLYCPALGRFLSMDPENQHTSPYLYGESDWVNYFDPDGALSGFWSSFLSILGGIACVALGVVITIATAGAGTALGVGLSILGVGIAGAGVGMATYGFSTINGDFNAAELGIYVGMGFISGLIGGAASAGIAALAPTIGTLGTTILSIGTGAVLGGADSVVSNGLVNLVQGREFNDNWDVSLGIGCVVGAIGGLFSSFCSALRNSKTVLVGKQAATELQSQAAEAASAAAGKKGAFGNLAKSFDLLDLEGKALSRVLTWAFDPGQSEETAADVSLRMNEMYQNGQIASARHGFNQYFDPFAKNCTAYMIRRIAGCGLELPLWMRSPALVNKWMRSAKSFLVIS